MIGGKCSIIISRSNFFSHHLPEKQASLKSRRRARALREKVEKFQLAAEIEKPKQSSILNRLLANILIKRFPQLYLVNPLSRISMLQKKLMLPLKLKPLLLTRNDTMGIDTKLSKMSKRNSQTTNDISKRRANIYLIYLNFN